MRTRNSALSGLVAIHEQPVTLRVIELLPLVGDHAQERRRVAPGHALKSHVHSHGRLDHVLRRRVVAHGDERGQTAEGAA